MADNSKLPGFGAGESGGSFFSKSQQAKAVNKVSPKTPSNAPKGSGGNGVQGAPKKTQTGAQAASGSKTAAQQKAHHKSKLNRLKSDRAGGKKSSLPGGNAAARSATGESSRLLRDNKHVQNRKAKIAEKKAQKAQQRKEKQQADIERRTRPDGTVKTSFKDFLKDEIQDQKEQMVVGGQIGVGVALAVSTGGSGNAVAAAASTGVKGEVAKEAGKYAARKAAEKGTEKLAEKSNQKGKADVQSHLKKLREEQEQESEKPQAKKADDSSKGGEKQNQPTAAASTNNTKPPTEAELKREAKRRATQEFQQQHTKASRYSSGMDYRGRLEKANDKLREKTGKDVVSSNPEVITSGLTKQLFLMQRRSNRRKAYIKSVVKKVVLFVAVPMLLVFSLIFGTLFTVIFAASVDELNEEDDARCIAAVAMDENGSMIGAELDAIQQANARTVVGVGKALGIPKRGILIAIMVGLTESELRRNAVSGVPESLTYPHDYVQNVQDHTSVGMFQQQNWWGSVQDRMSGVTSTFLFFHGGRDGSPGLLSVPNWESKELYQAAHGVQRSAYPLRVQSKLARATVLLESAMDQPPIALNETYQRYSGSYPLGYSDVTVGPYTGNQGTKQDDAPVGSAADTLPDAASVWPVTDSVEQGAETGDVPAEDTAPNTFVDPLAVSKKYPLGNVPEQTSAVATHLGTRFGFKTIGGYRAGNANGRPTDHSAGLALDLMTNDLDNGDDVGFATAKYIVENADVLGVKYLIWHQRIWNASKARDRMNPEWATWRMMEDRGNITQNHFDHIHLSLTGNGQMVGPSSLANLGDPCGNGGTSNGGTMAVGDWAPPIKGSECPNGRITSNWGPRIHPILGYQKPHNGVDIGCPEGTPLYAAISGTLIQQPNVGSCGNMTKVRNEQGTEIVYCHMHSFTPSPDGTVQAGQPVGTVGNTGVGSGPHLHFAVKKNGVHINTQEVYDEMRMSFWEGRSWPNPRAN